VRWLGILVVAGCAHAAAPVTRPLVIGETFELRRGSWASGA